MSRILVLVEGPTEEVFLNQVVGPAFRARGTYLIPKILTTKTRKDGLQFKGGVSSYHKVRRDLLRLLGDTAATAVTTMLDFYGLPADFPGVDDAPAGDPYGRVRHLEEKLQQDVDRSRFIPYLSLHEFEALVLAGPDELADAVEPGRVKPGLRELRGVLATVRSPEEINDGEKTHPSARLEALFPGYQKTLHGRLITARIGLPRLRRSCPHFDAWLRRLEDLA